ncbi:MAG: Zn-ribbon domain-containing OB-fold protein [Thermodesulfobacteriota bacterium]
MALTERLQNTTEVGYWTGEIPLEYIYTYGRAGEAYFRSLKEKGVFTGARCDRCGITYVPPRIYCEKCFDRLEDRYLEVSFRGTVHTFTVLYRNLDGSEKETPLIMAMVALDGVYGGVVHCLGEIKPEEVCIGLPVEAVLKPLKEREGAITDVKYFKPVK